MYRAEVSGVTSPHCTWGPRHSLPKITLQVVLGVNLGKYRAWDVERSLQKMERGTIRKVFYPTVHFSKSIVTGAQVGMYSIYTFI